MFNPRSPIFFLKILVFSFKFTTIIHFNFLYDLRYWSNFILLQIDIQLSHYFISYLIILTALSNINRPYMYRFISELSKLLLFYISLCQHHTVMIIVASKLWRNVSLHFSKFKFSNLFFFCNVLTILNLLHFYINVRISLFLQKVIWNFRGITLNIRSPWRVLPS